MFDFLSYVRDSHLSIRILPPPPNVLISFELIDPATGYSESHDITDAEARRCGNIDVYTGQILDEMAARIGRRKAEEYSRKHGSRQLRERERFFRNE